MSVEPAHGFLLLRRAGGVWGIDNAAVSGLAARDHGFRIATADGALVADEILGVVAALNVHPPSRVLRRYWGEAPAGLAVYERLPVVVVDPRRPPAALRLDEGDRLG